MDFQEHRDLVAGGYVKLSLPGDGELAAAKHQQCAEDKETAEIRRYLNWKKTQDGFEERSGWKTDQKKIKDMDDPRCPTCGGELVANGLRLRCLTPSCQEWFEG